MDRLKDRLAICAAWWLPRRLVYWCAIRVGTNATQGRYQHQIAPELGFIDALTRWESECE